MQDLRRRWQILSALFVANMKSHGPNTKKLFIMSLFMMIQNSMFFVLWIILFGSVRDLHGYQLADIARCFGIVSSAIGLSLFFFGGVRSIPYRVADGSFDAFLTKPAHPLPQVMFSSSYPASLGDVFYGPLMWWAFGDIAGLNQWLAMGAMTLIAAVLFFSAMLAFYCIPFWMKGSARFPDQLFEMFIIASTNILKNQPLGVKIILYSLIPAGFLTNIPLQLSRQFDWGLFAVMAGAACFYALLSFRIFNAGVRRYVRG